MSTFYLINTVILATTKLFPGALVDDAIDDTDAIEAAGGALWPSSDTAVAAAAATCAAFRLKGANEDFLNSLMISAAALSVNNKTTADLSDATPQAVGTAAAGTGTEAARDDHVHAHGNQLGGTLHANANTTTAGFQTAAQFNKVAGGAQYVVRGVVAANVADLTAFTVASNDGLTYAAGQRVLLAKQTTASQNGVYVVGTVGGGSAPLTRALDLPAGQAIQNGMVVEVSEGTLYAGSSWKAMCTGACVIATDDPLFYPRKVFATVTLAAGVKALGSTEGLWLFSTTKSSVQATYNTPDTITATVGLKCAVADRTAGKVGTAAATIKAVQADASTDTANVSTVDVLVTNW